MFDLVSDLTLGCGFSDTGRLKNLVMEYQAGMESAIVRNGHQLAMSLAARNASPGAFMNELWFGIHQLQKIRELAEKLDGGKAEQAALEALAEDLGAIGKSVFSGVRPRIALIGEERALSAAEQLAGDLVAGFEGAKADQFTYPDLRTAVDLPWEGWTTSTAVSFVAEVMQTPRLIHPDAPALAVMGKLMRSMYLHREIREKGGAYGGFSLYSPEAGLFSFASYRDPHIRATVDAFEGARRFVCQGDFSDEDVKEAVLQICSDIDNPDAPGAAARKAFQRELVALDDGLRIRFKQGLLNTERDQIVNLAASYFGDEKQGRAVAVISNAEKLTAANRKMGGRPLTIHRI
jgi:Zn-dependent M16 (insulinase) family peptidase